MGLKGGARARVNAKRGNNMEAPGDGRASVAYSNVISDAEDTSETQDMPSLVIIQVSGVGAHDK